jgi:hypothetical protein
VERPLLADAASDDGVVIPAGAGDVDDCRAIVDPFDGDPAPGEFIEEEPLFGPQAIVDDTDTWGG